jgi:hypothetical protein
MPQAPAHPLFDRFKQLEGRWEGAMKMAQGGESMPAVVEFHLTAGGSALVQTDFPGTPMEMVSVYYLDGDQLKMTHYCMLQNQPTLIAQPGKDENTIELRFESITNMPDPNGMHMRNATFEFVDVDHYRCHGEGYVNGKPAPESCGVMEMRRVKPEAIGKTQG